MPIEAAAIRRPISQPRSRSKSQARGMTCRRALLPGSLTRSNQWRGACVSWVVGDAEVTAERPCPAGSKNFRFTSVGRSHANN